MAIELVYVGLLSHAILRAFVAAFRAVRGFLRGAVAVFLTWCGLNRGSQFPSGLFRSAMRPLFSGRMRATSSSVRS